MTDELAPIDDVPALEPIAGIPDWCNDFFEKLLDPQCLGVIRYAAESVGRTWYAVDYWRKRSPEFAARFAEIYALVHQDVNDQLEYPLLYTAIHGHKKITRELNDDGELVITKEETIFDPKVAQWLIGKRDPQRYGDQEGQSALEGDVVIVFKMTDQSAAPDEIEGETIEDAEVEDQPALSSGDADAT